MNALAAPAAPRPGGPLLAPWVPVAAAELGVRETRGGETPRILEYHATTSLRASEDEVPWCSAYACWVMEQVGLHHPRSARARSWEAWGVEVGPTFGAIAVLTRGTPGSGQGHVGFLLHADERRVWLLGGNQSNAVSVASYPREQLITCRWPGQGTG